MIMNESDSQVEADKGLCADNFFRIQFLCLLYKYLYHFVFVQYAVKHDIHAIMCIVCKCMANMGSLNIAVVYLVTCSFCKFSQTNHITAMV